MGVVGGVVLLFDPDSHVGRVWCALFLFEVFLILAIVPHELGHAVVARLIGWRVFAIVIGLGKNVFRCNMLGFSFEFRRWPIAGLTLAMPVDVRHFRLKRFAMILAGPMVNAVLAVGVLVAWQGSPRNFDVWALPLVPRVFMWANAFVFLANLWPYHSKSGFNVASDGKQLFKTLFFKEEALKEVGAMRFFLEAMACRERGDSNAAQDWCEKGLAQFPENFQLLNLNGINHLDQQRYQSARQIFLKLLAAEGRPGMKRYLMLNNVAYATALTHDPQLLPEADAYSKEAFENLGWVPAIVGTRGTVLVAMGNHEEGISYLKRSLAAADSALSKAENACHLAVAHFRLGMIDQARKYVQLARELNDKCRLIPGTELEIEGKDPAPPQS